MIFAIRNELFWDWVRFRLTGRSLATAPVDIQSLLASIRKQHGLS